MACFFDRLLVRQRVGYLLAVRGFGDFVTGHRCLGEESPREESGLGKVYQRAVMRCPGIVFPTPYPQGYGATPPLPRPPQSACDVPGSMPEAAPYGNAGCVVHRGRANGRPHSVTDGIGPRRPPAPAAESRHRARRTGGRRPGAPPQSNAGKRPSDGVFSCSPMPVARVAFGTSGGTPTGRMQPSPGPATPARPAGPHSTDRAAGACGRAGTVARSGLRAGQTTDSGLRNHIFSANFSPLPIPWVIGRSTPLPPGKKRPGGTLPPNGDGPRMRGALPCTACE